MQFISRLLAASVATALLLAIPARAAEEAAAPAEDHTADFKVLTTDFQRLDSIFAQFTDPVHKIPTSGFIYLLKQRATLLGWKPPQGMLMGGGGGRGAQGAGYGGRGSGPKIEFDQVKYDELRYDINLQYQRIAAYLAPLRTPPPLSEPTVSIELRNLSIDPANQAEVKAALGVLDTEIKRASARVASAGAGSQEAARLERLKQRRAQLGQQFTQARWDELLAEFAPAE
jgi:hypothetical protein